MMLVILVIVLVAVAAFEGVLAWSLFVTEAPWVPLSTHGIAALLEGLEPLTSGAVVVELGSGDGRVLRAVVDRYPQARGIGLEQSRLLTWFARIRNRGRALEFRHVDCFRESWVGASCVFCYLLPPSMSLVANKALRELAADARVFTLGFPIPGLHPLRVIAHENREPCYEYRVGDMRDSAE